MYMGRGGEYPAISWALHDDDMAWKAFSTFLALWGKSTGEWWIPVPKGPVMMRYAFRRKLLNKQSSCQWFERPWCSYRVTVMAYAAEWQVERPSPTQGEEQAHRRKVASRKYWQTVEDALSYPSCLTYWPLGDNVASYRSQPYPSMLNWRESPRGASLHWGQRITMNLEVLVVAHLRETHGLELCHVMISKV